MDEERSHVSTTTGGGGKMTRRSFRTRTSSTPYDRPVAARKPERWFSKFLPSFLTSRSQDPSPSSTPPPELEDLEDLPELEEEARGVGVAHLSEEPEASAKTEQQQIDSKAKELAEDKSRNSYTDSVLADIEQQLKHKSFSRDDTDRLIELLRLRTIDPPEDDSHVTRSTLQEAETIPGQRNLRTTSKEEYPVHMPWRTSDAFQHTAQNIDSSPIEIAKAYMGAHTSPSTCDRQSGHLRNESLLCRGKSVSKQPSTSAAKPPICWPGAVVPSNRGYLTPQRGRVGLVPRTPYSGAIFTKSSSKFQANGGRTNSSAGRMQSSTSIFDSSTKKTLKRKNSDSDDGFASVGPLRLVRPKSTTSTASRGVTPSAGIPFLSKSSFSNQGNNEPSSSKGSFFNFQSSNGDDEAPAFAIGLSTVHPQSSKMANKILEHLNRTVPSPKEKSAELKLAAARTTGPSTSSILAKKDEHDDSHVGKVFDEQKTGSLLGRDIVTQEGSAKGKKVSPEPSPSTSKAKDGLKPLQTDKQNIFGLVTASSESNHSSLKTPIAFSKLSDKLNSYDNGVSFSFPSAPNPFSEPPTPTMTSAAAASKVRETSGTSIPSFEFGSTKSENKLVFSFGSPSASSDTTAPVFKFGDEKKPTLSFKPIGKDAFCC